jgi:hypothetical protein
MALAVAYNNGMRTPFPTVTLTGYRIKYTRTLGILSIVSGIEDRVLWRKATRYERNENSCAGGFSKLYLNLLRSTGDLGRHL